VRNGRDLPGSDDDRGRMRDSDLQSCFGVVLPGWHDYGDLHDKRAKLHVQGDGCGQHAAGVPELCGDHDGGATIVPVRDEHGGELHDADGNGQLPWDTICDVRTACGVDVPGGDDFGDLHGQGCVQ
jgi:hypothetical protein